MRSEIDRAHQWIVSDHVGASSTAIWSHMMGVTPKRGWSHPYDPDDLSRCLRLLRAIPEWASRMPEMARRSPAWAKLINRWGEIAACMDDEAGWDWSKARAAPKTYDLMKTVLGDRV